MVGDGGRIKAAVDAFGFRTEGGAGWRFYGVPTGSLHMFEHKSFIFSRSLINFRQIRTR